MLGYAVHIKVEVNKDYMMSGLKERKELHSYYRDSQVTKNYVDKRFQHALGRVLHEKQVGVVNRVIRDSHCENILELACGPARLTCDVEGGKYRVALDGSDNMIAEGTRRLKESGKDGRWYLQVADIFDMTLNEQFDLIYSFRFIRHFTLPDRQRIYRKIEKHLAPGGLIIFDVINRLVSEPVRSRDGIENYPIYDELYTEDEFRTEMATQGWRIQQLIPVHPQYEWLRFLQIYIAPRSDLIAYRLMHWIENHLRAKPLEWVAVCRFG